MGENEYILGVKGERGASWSLDSGEDGLFFSRFGLVGRGFYFRVCFQVDADALWFQSFELGEDECDGARDYDLYEFCEHFRAGRGRSDLRCVDELMVAMGKVKGFVKWVQELLEAELAE